jgi:hypothetical protein
MITFETSLRSETISPDQTRDLRRLLPRRVVPLLDSRPFVGQELVSRLKQLVIAATQRVNAA